jgi:hypothetical protein
MSGTMVERVSELTSKLAEAKRMLALREQQLAECTVAMREAATELREGAQGRIDDNETMFAVADKLMQVRYECGHRSWFTDVLAFMKKYRQFVSSHPTTLSPHSDVVTLRKRLIDEELAELYDAMAHNDLPEIADACVDLCYVVIGTAIAYGLDIQPLWDEVHRANMAKVMIGDPLTAKVSKPEGWAPPDVLGALKKGKAL